MSNIFYNDFTPLIIGGDSLIGRALCKQFAIQKVPYLATSRRTPVTNGHIYFDLSDETSWVNIPWNKISAAFICAGITNVIECNENPQKSQQINVEQTYKFLKRCLRQGTQAIFPSTNLIYDGLTPHQLGVKSQNPKAQHGIQKLEVQNQILEEFPNLASVVVFTKVIETDTALYLSWINALSENKIITPFLDKVCSPIPLAFITGALSQVATQRIHGLIQLSGEIDVSYAEIAEKIAAQMNISKSLIVPIGTPEQIKQLGALPQHTTLDTSSYRTSLKGAIPKVWDSVTQLVGQLLSSKKVGD